MTPNEHAPRARQGLIAALLTAAAAVFLFFLVGAEPKDAEVVVFVQPATAKVRLDVLGPGGATREQVATAGRASFAHLPRGARVRVFGAAPGHQDAAADATTAADGASVDVTLHLVAERGVLAVRTTPPGAYLFLDGKQAGRAPAALADVPAGTHVIEARLTGYTSAQATVTVKEGQVVPIELTLVAGPNAPALVVERAVPDGRGRVVMTATHDVQFYVDNQLVGTGKKTWRDLAPGPHQAIARPPGQDQQYRRFTIEDGETVELDFTFADNPIQKAYDATDPGKAIYWVIKGGNMRGEGRYGESIQHFKRALELDPNDYEAHRQLGRTYPVFKKWDDAIHHAEQYLALNPDAPDAEFEREMIEIYQARKAAKDTRMVMPGDPGQGEYPGDRALP